MSRKNTKAFTIASFTFAQKTEILKTEVVDCFATKLFELKDNNHKINAKHIEQIFIKCIRSSYIKLLLQKYLEEIIKNTVESNENKLVLDNLKSMIHYLHQFKIDFVKHNIANITNRKRTGSKRTGGKRTGSKLKPRTRKMKGGWFGFITTILITILAISKISASDNSITSISELQELIKIQQKTYDEFPKTYVHNDEITRDDIDMTDTTLDDTAIFLLNHLDDDDKWTLNYYKKLQDNKRLYAIGHELRQLNNEVDKRKSDIKQNQTAVNTKLTADMVAAKQSEEILEKRKSTFCLPENIIHIIDTQIETYKIPFSLNPDNIDLDSRISEVDKTENIKKVDEIFRANSGMFNMDNKIPLNSLNDKLIVFNKNVDLMKKFESDVFTHIKKSATADAAVKTDKNTVLKLYKEKSTFWYEITMQKIYKIIHLLNPSLNIMPINIVAIDFINHIVETEYLPNGDIVNFLGTQKYIEFVDTYEVQFRDLILSKAVLYAYGIQNRDAHASNVFVIGDGNNIVFREGDINRSTKILYETGSYPTPFDIFELNNDPVIFNANMLYKDVIFYSLNDKFIHKLNNYINVNKKKLIEEVFNTFYKLNSSYGITLKKSDEIPKTFELENPETFELEISE